MAYKEIRFWKIKTSDVELKDVTKAWLALSLAFTFAFAGLSIIDGNFSFAKIFSWQFLRLLLISAFTAGIGFLFHELAHKFTAQHYGCAAEFRAFDQMLYLALGMAILIGFIFAAPGAVMISGMITRKENGIISVAGPLTNYALALIFMGLGFLFPAIGQLTAIGFQINLWLGLFNMIPFGNFDGIKIFHWNILVWTSMVAFGVIFLFVL